MEKSSVHIFSTAALSFFCTAVKYSFSMREKIATSRVPVMICPGRGDGAGAPCAADDVVLVCCTGGGVCFLGAVCCAPAKAVPQMRMSRDETKRIKSIFPVQVLVLLTTKY